MEMIHFLSYPCWIHSHTPQKSLITKIQDDISYYFHVTLYLLDHPTSSRLLLVRLHLLGGLVLLDELLNLVGRQDPDLRLVPLSLQRAYIVM